MEGRRQAEASDPLAIERFKSAREAERSREDAADAVLIEEYRALWTYYIRTVDARERVFEIYTKIVGLPLVLSAGFLFYARSLAPQSEKIISALTTEERCGPICEALKNVLDALKNAEIGLAFFFLLSFLAGLGCYNYYALESLNSRNYLLALTSIRNLWRTRHPALHGGLTIDLVRPADRKLGDKIVRARGAVFVIFNTAIGTVSAWFFCSALDLVHTVPPGVFFWLGMLIGAAAHLLIGSTAQLRYRPDAEGKAIREATFDTRDHHARMLASRNDAAGGGGKA